MVQYLLDYAAHVDVADTTGMTPLILAADGGHVAVVTLLLNAAASVDVPDPFGKTAMMFACANSHEHVVAVRDSKVDIPDLDSLRGLSVPPPGGAELPRAPRGELAAAGSSSPLSMARLNQGKPSIKALVAVSRAFMLVFGSVIVIVCLILFFSIICLLGILLFLLFALLLR